MYLQKHGNGADGRIKHTNKMRRLLGDFKQVKKLLQLSDQITVEATPYQGEQRCVIKCTMSRLSNKEIKTHMQRDNTAITVKEGYDIPTKESFDKHSQHPENFMPKVLAASRCLKALHSTASCCMEEEICGYCSGIIHSISANWQMQTYFRKPNFNWKC